MNKIFMKKVFLSASALVILAMTPAQAMKKSNYDYGSYRSESPYQMVKFQPTGDIFLDQAAHIALNLSESVDVQRLLEPKYAAILFENKEEIEIQALALDHVTSQLGENNKEQFLRDLNRAMSGSMLAVDIDYRDSGQKDDTIRKVNYFNALVQGLNGVFQTSTSKSSNDYFKNLATSFQEKEDALNRMYGKNNQKLNMYEKSSQRDPVLVGIDQSGEEFLTDDVLNYTRSFSQESLPIHEEEKVLYFVNAMKILKASKEEMKKIESELDMLSSD